MIAIDASFGSTDPVPLIATQVWQGRDIQAFLQVSALSEEKPDAKVGLIGIGIPVPAIKYLTGRQQFYAEEDGLTVVGHAGQPVRRRHRRREGGERAAPAQPGRRLRDRLQRPLGARRRDRGPGDGQGHHRHRAERLERRDRGREERQAAGDRAGRPDRHRQPDGRRGLQPDHGAEPSSAPDRHPSGCARESGQRQRDPELAGTAGRDRSRPAGAVGRPTPPHRAEHDDRRIRSCRRPRCTSATGASTRSGARASRSIRARCTRSSARTARASRRCSTSSRARSGRTPARCRSPAGPRTSATPRRRFASGIATVTQETTLAPDLSITENVFLGHRMVRRGPVIDWRATRRRALEALRRLGLDVDPSLPVRRLRPDQQQMVEIARALSIDARVLVLDEPTSSLTDDEVGLALRARSARCGTRASRSIFVSHRLKEVFELADRVTVLRDGRTVGEAPARGARPAGADPAHGRARARGDRAAGGAGARRASRAPRARRLALPRSVSGRRSRGGARRDRRSRRARRRRAERAARGACSACTARAQARSRSTASQVTFGNPRQAIAGGVAFVPADRKLQGLVHGMSVRENLVMASTSRFARLRRPAKRRELPVVRDAFEGMRIRARSSRVPVATLSGGNQQKVVLGKWLATSPRVLMLDEPTRGVDVGAKSEIYQLLFDAAGAGRGDRRLVVREPGAADAVRPGPRDVPRPRRRRAFTRRRDRGQDRALRGRPPVTAEAPGARPGAPGDGRPGRRHLVGREPLRGRARAARRDLRLLLAHPAGLLLAGEHREPAHRQLDPVRRLDRDDVRRADGRDRPLGRLAAGALGDHPLGAVQRRRPAGPARGCRDLPDRGAARAAPSTAC